MLNLPDLGFYPKILGIFSVMESFLGFNFSKKPWNKSLEFFANIAKKRVIFIYSLQLKSFLNLID